MSKWLSRLAFSFLILAGLSAWHGRKLAAEGQSPTLYYLAAATFAVLFFLGLRERHRREGDR